MCVRGRPRSQEGKRGDMMDEITTAKHCAESVKSRGPAHGSTCARARVTKTAVSSCPLSNIIVRTTAVRARNVEHALTRTIRLWSRDYGTQRSSRRGERIIAPAYRSTVYGMVATVFGLVEKSIYGDVRRSLFVLSHSLSLPHRPHIRLSA